MSNEIYKKLFETAPIGLALNSMDGRFLDVNDAFFKMMGYTKEEFLSISYWDITPAEYNEQEELQLESLRTHGQYGPYEKEYIHKNGYRLPVLLNGVLVENDQGEKLIWSTVENVSDMRKTEKLLQKAQQMANIGHWNLDLEKNELTWSDETYRIFGLKPQEFSATYEAFVERVYPDDRDAVNEAYSRSIETKEQYEIDHRVIRPNGEIRYVHERCEHRFDDKGNIIGSIGTVLDVTKQHESEQELRTAKEKAEAANEAKSIFIANMSHELRTPMNAILGFSQLMARDENLTSEQQRSISIINNSGAHLLAMINEILDLSKIESGTMKVTESSFELSELINGLYDMMEVKAKEKQLSYRFDIDEQVPKYIKTDKNKLKQVLINIIGNAIKFTKEGSVTINITNNSPLDSDRIELLIDVTDTGCGIPKSMHEEVFRPFVQDRKEHEEGAGLGLAISKKILRLLDGSISLESEVGKGSTFHIRLPVKTGDAQDAVDENPIKNIIGIKAGQKKFKVLIVDDIDSNRTFMALMLKEIGFGVKEASEGEKAIQLYNDWKPDLILMDIRMPGIDGYQAISQIRSLPQGDQVKIIVLSANMIKSEQEIMSLQQSDGFIGIPFEMDQLLEMMSQMLGIEYLYDNTTENLLVQSSGIDPSWIDQIPAEKREMIYSAAVIGNGKELKRAIAIIADDFPSLAEHLSTLSSKYDFDAIVTLLKR